MKTISLIKPHFILLAFLLSLSQWTYAQRSPYEAYIDTYKGLAVEQMERYGIPASITLAQGLLESAAGQSELSRKANNHFGIKCGGSWNGPYVLRDDDARNEKFRAYSSPRESYEDHSVFLATRSRYAFLFKYKKSDYKAWAHGLKKAGYATNPRYAHLLIKLIHRYDLDRYDKMTVSDFPSLPGALGEVADGLIVRRNNDNYYVIARGGDTFASIGREMGVSERKLRKYNEVDKHYRLQAGDIVYLEKKRSKADKAFKGKYHTVRPGESLYTIAQKYGIPLKTLYKNNDLTAGDAAFVGGRLKIR